MFQEERNLANLLAEDTDSDPRGNAALPDLGLLFRSGAVAQHTPAAGLEPQQFEEATQRAALSDSCPRIPAASASDELELDAHIKELTTEAIRSKNRIAQAKYRTKVKKRRDELEGAIDQCRTRLLEQKDRQWRLQAQSKKLTDRCTAAATQLQQLTTPPAYSETIMSNDASSPGTEPAEHARDHQGILLSSKRPRKACPAQKSTRLPPAHQPTSAFPYHAALTLDCILGSVPNPCSAVSWYPAQQQGELPDALPETLASCRQDIALRRGVPVDQVCWYMQLPYEADKNLSLSVSTQAGSVECYMSSYMFFFFLIMELELLRLAGHAHGDFKDQEGIRSSLLDLLRSHDLCCNTPGQACSPGQASPRAVRATDRHRHRRKADIRCRVGVNETMLVQPVARRVIEDMATRYAEAVPDRVNAGAALMRTLLDFQHKCQVLGTMHMHDWGLMQLLEMMLIEVQGFFVQHRPARVRASEARQALLVDTESAFDAWTDRLRLHCQLILHFVTAERFELHYPGKKMLKITAKMPVSESMQHCSSMFADLNLSPQQMRDLNSAWSTWKQSRLAFSTQLHAVLQSLNSVPTVLDLPVGLVKGLYEWQCSGDSFVGVGAQDLHMVVANASRGGSVLRGGFGSCVGRFIGPSVACTSEVQQHLRRLEALAVSEWREFEEMQRRIFRHFTFQQVVLMIWVNQPFMYLVDLFQVCQCAAQQHRQNVVLRGVSG